MSYSQEMSIVGGLPLLGLFFLPFWLSPDERSVSTTINGTSVSVAGPAYVSKWSPLHLLSGYLWLQTNEQPFTFSIRRRKELVLNPYSSVYCEARFETSSCTVLTGRLVPSDPGAPSIDDGGIIELESLATDFVSVLPELKEQDGRLQLYWSRTKAMRPPFLVTVSYRADMARTHFSKSTLEQELPLPRDTERILYAQITGLNWRKTRRVSSVVMPIPPLSSPNLEPEETTQPPRFPAPSQLTLNERHLSWNGSPSARYEVEWRGTKKERRWVLWRESTTLDGLSKGRLRLRAAPASSTSEDSWSDWSEWVVFP